MTWAGFRLRFTVIFTMKPWSFLLLKLFPVIHMIQYRMAYIIYKKKGKRGGATPKDNRTDKYRIQGSSDYGLQIQLALRKHSFMLGPINKAPQLRWH
ncbi:hypothetical protein F0562_020105 [Nyssa sinensis]|uniref:Uncharacterized protein n=1 Tax=Nyssa sinensis TaxID=561372 RepID=A0A5J5BVK7_9ASTE|nr:hypothetical protein F0562_020105 [Nyssa sinensis]